MGKWKYAVTLSKGRAVKFISHHDLARAFERMLRRSGLPYELTEGFHKRPRISFSPALALGLTSNCEVAIISLKEPIEPEEVRRRLAREAPRGIKVVKVERDHGRFGWLFSQALWAEYALNVEFKEAPQMAPQRMAWEIERVLGKGVRKVRLLSSEGKRVRLKVALQVVGEEAVRPSKLLEALKGLGGPIQLAHICRTRFLKPLEVVERGDER